MRHFDRVYVVGSGLFGSVIAERVANDLHLPVTIIEKRSHIGGNCYSHVDEETGVEYHKYGSHIFHTSNTAVWNYIRGFTEFNDYRHRVWTTVNNRIYSMPINLATINHFYGLALTPDEARKFIADEIAAAGIQHPDNLEDKAISLIGVPLYQAFFCGYSTKQWGCSLRSLPADIITRLPLRYNYNNRYFSDRYEGIPLDGYSAMFRRMLTNPLIELRLRTDFDDVRGELPENALVVYTGPIDRYFACRFGKLEWRTVTFEIERHNVPDYQGTSVMNYGDVDVPYTRIHEFRHYHPERNYGDKTIIFKEYSKATGGVEEPYYPVNTPRNQELMKAYREEAKRNPNVIFGGRLGEYRYFDMDKSIESALNCYSNRLKPMITGDDFELI